MVFLKVAYFIKEFFFMSRVLVWCDKGLFAQG